MNANPKRHSPHHFTVDVEEFFHSTALEPWIPRASWDSIPRRAPEVLDRLLELLHTHEVRGTFFTLGWMAEREPEMVRRISAAGHEIASHGWTHRVTMELTPAEFREELRSSKAILEEVAGVPVWGFRAPSFSIIPGFEWALDLLLEEGYRYDSSLYPVSTHPSYGYPCPRDPHRIERPGGVLAEIPPATLRFFGINLPAGGGAYFRFFPYALLRSALWSAEGRGVPGTFYIHPWELDGGLPPIDIPWRQKLRTRGRTANPWARVRRLLTEMDFRRMDETARELLGADSLTRRTN